MRPSFHSVEGVALGQAPLFESRGVWRRGSSPWDRRGKARSFKGNPVKRWDQLFAGAPSHDAVKIVGKALSFHGGLRGRRRSSRQNSCAPNPCRRTPAGSRATELPSHERRDTEVGHLFGMPDGPRRVTSLVAVVRARDAKPRLRGSAKAGNWDAAAQPPFSHLLILPFQPMEEAKAPKLIRNRRWGEP